MELQQSEDQLRNPTMFKLALGFLSVWAMAHAAPAERPFPIATLRMEPMLAYTAPHTNQDFFFGMPYAQQPVGNMRFTVPQSLNESWNGMRDAQGYSDICVGYGVSLCCLR